MWDTVYGVWWSMVWGEVCIIVVRKWMCHMSYVISYRIVLLHTVHVCTLADRIGLNWTWMDWNGSFSGGMDFMIMLWNTIGDWNTIGRWEWVESSRGRGREIRKERNVFEWNMEDASGTFSEARWGGGEVRWGGVDRIGIKWSDSRGGGNGYGYGYVWVRSEGGRSHLASVRLSYS